MPTYTLHFRPSAGASDSLERLEAPSDSAAFAMAADVLGQHPDCDQVDVFDGERAVVSRHRHQPILRPVEQSRLEQGPARSHAH